MSRKPLPICPKCGERAVRRTTRYGPRNSCCDLWSWGNAPLVDKATHDARQAAHAAFDPVWKQGHLNRGDAYALLAGRLGLTGDECHMKKMDTETARRVPQAAADILAGLQTPISEGNPMNKYAVIDTETTGLFDFSKPADAEGQPRLASITTILVDDSLEVEEITNTLVKPDGWEMSEGASRVNGLTTERLHDEGIPIADVLDAYDGVIDQRYIITAFNAQYDTKIMRAEYRRAERNDRFETTPNICVMRALTDICQVPRANGRGFKFPKLAEACAHFGITNEAAHTSRGDAEVALELLRRLHNLNAIPEPKVHYAKNRPV